MGAGSGRRRMKVVGIQVLPYGATFSAHASMGDAANHRRAEVQRLRCPGHSAQSNLVCTRTKRRIPQCKLRGLPPVHA